MSGLVAWLPVALALVAEASWIAAVAGLVEAFLLRPSATGVLEMLLAATAGLLAARFLGPRLGTRWPALAVVLAATCGVIGWLWSPESRVGLADAGLRTALGTNPGGWLAFVAFVRGMGYSRIPLDPGRVGTLVAVGVPGLALVAIAGRLMGEPWRGGFLSIAQLEVLLFLASSLTALVLARVTLAAGGIAVDWRRNPAWLAMVLVLLAVTLALAVWVSLAAGETIALAVTILVVPVALIGLVAGIDWRALRIFVICVLAAGVIAVIVRALQGLMGPNPPPPPPFAGPGEQPQAPDQVGLVGILIVLAIVVAIVFILARLAIRRGSTVTEDDEIREIAYDAERESDARHRRRSRFRRRPAPVDAVAAYRDLLEDLEGRPPVQRDADETPAEHARRLRETGLGGLPLDLLAADYGLARFGGIALTPAEHRRAVARFSALRRRLLAVPVSRGARGAAPDDAAPDGAARDDGDDDVGAGGLGGASSGSPRATAGPSGEAPRPGT